MRLSPLWWGRWYIGVKRLEITSGRRETCPMPLSLAQIISCRRETCPMPLSPAKITSGRRETCPNATQSSTNPTWTALALNQDLHNGNKATSRLSHRTTRFYLFIVLITLAPILVNWNVLHNIKFWTSKRSVKMKPVMCVQLSDLCWYFIITVSYANF
jgi:hypothetical protein